MRDIRLIMADIQGVPIGELSYLSLELKYELRKPSQAKITTNFKTEWFDLTLPGVTIYVLHNDIPIFCGIVVKTEHKLDEDQTTLELYDKLVYFRKRYIFGASSPVIFDQVEEGDIAWYLLYTAMTDITLGGQLSTPLPYYLTYLPIEKGTIDPIKLRDRTYNDNKQVLEAVTQLSEVIAPYERTFYMSPNLTDNRSFLSGSADYFNYVRLPETANPNIYFYKSDSQANITNLVFSSDLAEQSNSVVVYGQNSSEIVFADTFGNPVEFYEYFLLVQDELKKTDVTVSQTLIDAGEQHLAESRIRDKRFTFDASTYLLDNIGRYNVGDYVNIDIGYAGLHVQETLRIVSLQFNFSLDKEDVKVEYNINNSKPKFEDTLRQDRLRIKNLENQI